MTRWIESEQREELIETALRAEQDADQLSWTPPMEAAVDAVLAELGITVLYPKERA